MSNTKELDFAAQQKREDALKIGRKYLNIFHQLHFINAGMEILNNDFLTMSDDVIELLPELAGGMKLAQHIKNLKTGKTPINKIDADVLPFGELVFDDHEKFLEYTSYNKIAAMKNVESENNAETSSIQTEINNEYKQLYELLRAFKNTPALLENFKSSEVIRDLGPDWKNEVKNILKNSKEKDASNMRKTFDGLCVFDIALNYWQECVAIVKNPKSKPTSEIKDKLSDYKKYLAMFGAGGKDLYEKVKQLV